MSNSNSFTHTPCNHHIHEEGPEDKVPRLFCPSQCQGTQCRSKTRPVYAQQWVYQGLCTPCKSSKYWSTWGIPHWCTCKYQLRASATAFFFFFGRPQSKWEHDVNGNLAIPTLLLARAVLWVNWDEHVGRFIVHLCQQRTPAVLCCNVCHLVYGDEGQGA